MIFSASRILLCGFIVVHLVTLLLIAIYFVSRFFFFIKHFCKNYYLSIHICLLLIFFFLTKVFWHCCTYFLNYQHTFLKVLLKAHPDIPLRLTENSGFPISTAQEQLSLLFQPFWLQRKSSRLLFELSLGKCYKGHLE